MAHKRKGDKCLNCGQVLSPDHNFCPSCGQENDNRNVSVWVLIAELIEENIGIDSKLLRSIVPFVLQPGKLTVAFIAGQRKRYVPPLRMYLVASLLSFLMFSVAFKVIKEETLAAPKSNPAAAKDSTDEAGADTSAKKDNTFKFRFNQTRTNDIDKSELKSDSIPDKVIAQRMGLDTTEFMLKIVKQGRRFMRDQTSAIAALLTYAIDNANVAGILMLPFLALWLKLMYFRRTNKYINHLVHVLHLQSFTYFMIAISLFSEWALFPDDDSVAQEWIDNIIFVVIPLYHVISFKRVYDQSWLKTLLKTMIYMIFFGLMIFVTVLFLLFFSFYFFD